jgi:signal transduction histidine kinase
LSKTVAVSFLIVVVAAALAAAAAMLEYGLKDGVMTFGTLLALGIAALAVAHAGAAHRRRVGALRRQFSVAIAIAIGQILVAIAVGAALMFVSSHDAAVIAGIGAFAGVVAVRAAQLFAGGVMSDIERLRSYLVAVGEGTREPSPATAANDELAQLAEAASVAVARLAQAEGAQRDLIAAVSHDLRTPITSLQLLAEAIDDDIVDDETRRRYLSQMTTHIRALSALIDDLFELSRLEAGDISWSLERVRMEDLVGETVDAMRVQAEAKRVNVRAELSAGLRPARGDPEKLQRVLFNLIQNAIRHTPADGSVTVLAQEAGDRVEIEVADTGDGIDTDDRTRVFEPFFRAGADRARTTNGAGLGLAISRAIVEAHGGRIWLEDAPSGTRVRFSLPSAP